MRTPTTCWRLRIEVFGGLPGVTAGDRHVHAGIHASLRNGEKRQACEEDGYGGASQDRTDDLIVANSQPRARRRDSEEARIAPRGSVHAGLPAVPCPSPGPERQRPTAPETGRDARVTTQVTTQICSSKIGHLATFKGTLRTDVKHPPCKIGVRAS